MELNSSRAAARTDEAGEPILLLDQNRALWDQIQIRRGMQALAERGSWADSRPPGSRHRLPRPGENGERYRLVTHHRTLRGTCRGRALTNHRTQPRGCHRHGGGTRVGACDRGSPCARAYAESYHLLPSVRGDLLHKLGRYEEARAAFEAAAALAGRREHDLLRRRAAETADAAMSS